MKTSSPAERPGKCVEDRASADRPASSVSRSPAVYELPLEESSKPQPAPTERAAHQRTSTLYRENAEWFCRLRWRVVGLFAFIAGAALLPGSWQERMGLRFGPGFPFAVALILAFMNLVYRRWLDPRPQPPSESVVHRLLWAQITVDLLVLSAVIHWLGSRLAWTPHTYLFHIVLACIVFEARESIWVVALAIAAYLGCLALEATGAWPASSIFLSRGQSVSGDTGELVYHLAGLVLIWGVIWWLASRVATKLRDRELELAATNFRLEASCDERTAHMLQTTHQLKAPFAAIHAQVQLLLAGYCGELPPTAQEVLGKISTRCLALSRQIQEMLQLANLRSQGQRRHAARQVDIAALLEAAVKRLEPTARQRGIRIETHLEPVQVQAPEDHLTMMLENILANALTYSFDGGRVEVRCGPRERDEAEIVVRDEGIGIEANKLPHIFDDYYRTDEALRHNRSSTGLGLAVVRQVARSLRARIRVESAPGWGTQFTVRLPRSGTDAQATSPPFSDLKRTS